MEKYFSPEKKAEHIPKDIQEKANDLDRLVEMIKEKLETPVTRREKIQFSKNYLFIVSNFLLLCKLCFNLRSEALS